MAARLPKPDQNLMLRQNRIPQTILIIRTMEVVLTPFLKATPGGVLTKNCDLEAYKFLMNTWNALPPPYRRRVYQNTLARVKKRILDADTTCSNAPISTEAAQVDKELLAQFLATNAPLEGPQIGSRTEPGSLPLDVDEYEDAVSFDHGDSEVDQLSWSRRQTEDRRGIDKWTVPYTEPASEPEDDVRPSGRRGRKPGSVSFDGSGTSDEGSMHGPSIAWNSYQCAQDPNRGYVDDEIGDDNQTVDDVRGPKDEEYEDVTLGED